MSESNDWQIPGSEAEIYETVFVPAMMGECTPEARCYESRLMSISM